MVAKINIPYFSKIRFRFKIFNGSKESRIWKWNPRKKVPSDRFEKKNIGNDNKINEQIKRIDINE